MCAFTWSITWATIVKTNEDPDSNKKGKKAISFGDISLPSLHDYDSAFYWGRKHPTTTFFTF